MKRRFVCVCLTVFLLVALIGQGTVCFAKGADAAEEFALQFWQGVQAGEQSVSITCDASDGQEVCNEAFERYPVLQHYYGGMSYINYKTYTKMDVTFCNLQDPADQIFVITSEEEMFALVGAALSRLQPELKFMTTNGFILTEEIMERIAENIRHQYPLSYMGYQGWISSHSAVEGLDVRDYTLKFQWFDGLDLTTLKQWRQETEQAALRIAKTEFALDMPDELKILRIHDYLVNHTRYNIKNMDQPGNHLAYGALVRGSCVCQGYSEACLVLCQAAGLEAVYVPGDGVDDQGVASAHGWNAVKLNGEWYMLDTTWDDPVSDEDILRYDYFLVTNRFLQQDHIWQQEDYPLCTATTLNAQKVLDFAKKDQKQYTRYSDELLVTMAEAEEACQQVLKNCRPKLPGETGESSENDRPTQLTTGVSQNQKETRPTPPSGSSEPTSKDTDSGSGVWIVIVLLAVGGGAAFLIMRMRQPKKKPQKKVDIKRPTQRGFDDL